MILEEINAQIFVPVHAKKELVGIIILGEKKSTLPFDRDDLLLLSALSNQIAVAIENSRLYEDLEGAFIQTTVALANAIDLRDAYTNVHSQQIAYWSARQPRYLIAAQMRSMTFIGVVCCTILARSEYQMPF